MRRHRFPGLEDRDDVQYIPLSIVDAHIRMDGVPLRGPFMCGCARRDDVVTMRSDTGLIIRPGAAGGRDRGVSTGLSSLRTFCRCSTPAATRSGHRRAFGLESFLVLFMRRARNPRRVSLGSPDFLGYNHPSTVYHELAHVKTESRLSTPSPSHTRAAYRSLEPSTLDSRA